MPWPLPAVLAWALGWAAWLLLRAAGASAEPAFAAGLLAAAALACSNRGRWRQLIAAAGFPLSAWALGGAAAMPPWVWLLLLAPVLLAYPLRAWRDAPFFPTPAHALRGLDTTIATLGGLDTPPQRVLDAGCGLGHGLAALHRLWPTAQLHGIEWSPALAWLTALRCRLQRWPARAWRGDMWAGPWAGYDVVYVFQRPESMTRAFAKARLELAAGAWFVSLEFAVPGEVPVAVLQGAGRRPVWLYQPAAGRADMAAPKPRSAAVSPSVPRLAATARRSTTGPVGR